MVLEVFTRKNSSIVNKAVVAYIVSADRDLGTVTYDDSRRLTLRLSQAGRWNARDGGGSDPYVSFGRLQLPWTAQEEEDYLHYSLGN